VEEVVMSQSLFLWIAVASALVAPASQSRAARSPAALGEAVDRYLKPLRDLEVFDGVVLIGQGDRVLLSKGYGLANVELGISNTPERRFRIASLSKLFTALAIGRLAEQGVLDFQSPLSQFIPEFPSADRITIRMLLEHRAGVPSTNALPYIEDAVHQNSLDDLIAHIEKQPLDYPPGTKTRYSNGSYAVLARVIESATGRRYEDFLRDEILAPLGLRNTGHDGDGMIVANRAWGYYPDPRRAHGRVPAPFQQMATKTGGGSLYCTAGDLFRLGRALFRDNVVHRATYDSLFTIEGRTFLRTGRCPGFNALLLKWLDEDVTVVMLSNNYASGMLTETGGNLAAIALGGAPAPMLWRSNVTVPTGNLRVHVGRYRLPPNALPFFDSRMLDVRLDGGQLLLSEGDTPLDVLIPQTDRRFLARNLWSELKFDASTDTLVYRPLYMPGEFTLTRVEDR
jgi:CubicO group peptidase (beta-lactamase class C family)